MGTRREAAGWAVAEAAEPGEGEGAAGDNVIRRRRPATSCLRLSRAADLAIAPASQSLLACISEILYTPGCAQGERGGVKRLLALGFYVAISVCGFVAAMLIALRT